MPARDNLRKHLAQSFLRGEITWETMTDGIEEIKRESGVCQSPVCPCGCCNEPSSTRPLNFHNAEYEAKLMGFKAVEPCGKMIYQDDSHIRCLRIAGHSGDCDDRLR